MAAPARAPELAGRGGWVNTTGRLSLRALRGRIVLVHFWSASSVASLRVVDELRPLAEVYAEELVVVGVHSPRFPREVDHDVVAQAVARLAIGHPVLDDADHATAERYGVEVWPTVVVVGPTGVVVGSVEGDGVGPALRTAVAELVERHSADGTLRPAVLDVERVLLPPSPLAFPGKVACSPDGRRLAVADTAHDRVVVATAEGVVLEAHTGFLRPQGVRFDGRGVVVCDAGADRVVRTDGEVLADAVASPWDLVGDGRGGWVVAEAGGHRLVRVRPGELRTRVVAGSGLEGLEDALPPKALLAQPSGVARAAEGVVFVDAESSALRLVADEGREGRVGTLVGGPHFECGAEDGPPDRARLQWPLGVAADPAGGPVYVADTYNSRLRVWEDGCLRTLAVDGLDQPGGLDLLPDGRLVVADSANHRVVVVDPHSGAVHDVVMDETWVHASDGPALRARAGAPLRVPVAVDLVDEELDASAAAPLEVVVECRPRHLLDGGGRRQAVPHTGHVVEVRAGRAGRGILLVEVTARTRAPGRSAVRVQRRRHDLEVTQ